MRKNSILTVSQLNFYTKSLLEDDKILSSVFVQGEISNLTNYHRSGHIYFSLKDEKSVVKCVMFSGNAKKLRFTPQEGMNVIIIGRVSMYEASGQVQLYAEQMQPDGIGDLTIAYQQLKDKLEKQGLFDESHKKPIPKFPKKIGVITSDTGAVRRDIETVLSRRYPIVEMILYPSAVQGENAVQQLINGLKYFNKTKDVDVIIIGRGGGSMEDLWSFNSEKLAYEIYNSEIPVISAVGHATDHTICDYVADRYAQTPSVAGELAVPDKTEIFSQLNSLKSRMVDIIEYKIDSQQQMLDILANKLSMMSEKDIINKLKFDIDTLNTQLINAFKYNLQIKNETLKENIAKLNALSPLNVLSRGYSIAEKNGKVIKSVNNIDIGDKIDVILNNGKITCIVDNKVGEYNGKEENL